MEQLGNKIALKRKDLGTTQSEFAEKLSVTRQTVSRWEAGTVLPDIDKINDIAAILGVSCDYLLKDEMEEDEQPVNREISPLLQSALGKNVKLNFFPDEADYDLFDTTADIIGFEGNWLKVKAHTRKGDIEKLIPLSSVLSIEILKEDE